MTTSSTLSGAALKRSVTIIEVKPGLKFSLEALKSILPDVTTALFFGKVYELDAVQLSNVLRQILDTPLAAALLSEGGQHSTELQDYLVDMTQQIPDVDEGELSFNPVAPKGELLPQLWESLELEVADSIKAVAEKLSSTLGLMPGKQGHMTFKAMQVMNAKRPTLGDYKARIQHMPQQQNLVILDVSGSMSQRTIETIVDDVVALSYNANAHLAIVSNACTYWAPGTYGTSEVLSAATYGGTHYETLAPLFDQDWGVVVTIADYDSAVDARTVVGNRPGRIEKVLDVSLVDRPTFLAEVVGQLAAEVQPMLVAAQGRSLTRSSW